MHIGEQFPFIRRASPGIRNRYRMAGGTGAAQRIVGNIFLINRPLLPEPVGGKGLFRRQSMPHAEIGNNVPGFFRSQTQAVQPHHALNRLLPAFRSGPDIRDSGEISCYVCLVAAGTALDGQIVTNRYPNFGRFILTTSYANPTKHDRTENARRQGHASVYIGATIKFHFALLPVSRLEVEYF